MVLLDFSVVFTHYERGYNREKWREIIEQTKKEFQEKEGKYLFVQSWDCDNDCKQIEIFEIDE